jgi:CrcB protein
MIKSILLAFVGGGLGSVLRFLLGFCMAKFVTNLFPISTLIINILGSFLIGIFSAALSNNFNDLRTFLMIGFCGGFTTFSAFSLESLTLFRNGEILNFFIYIMLSLVLCIAFAFLGIIFVEFILKK